MLWSAYVLNLLTRSAAITTSDQGSAVRQPVLASRCLRVSWNQPGTRITRHTRITSSWDWGLGRDGAGSAPTSPAPGVPAGHGVGRGPRAGPAPDRGRTGAGTPAPVANHPLRATPRPLQPDWRDWRDSTRSAHPGGLPLGLPFAGVFQGLGQRAGSPAQSLID
jgi:hypothetical protein